jgi:cytochrome c biogenesis protein CcmG/thiol:disulfide interchange protein DsbE
VTSDQSNSEKAVQSGGAEGATARRGPNLLIALPIILFVALAIVFALSLKSGDPSRLPSALIGKPAPAVGFGPLEGLQANGKAVPGITAQSLRAGEVTVVNFWASWCVPCVQEHPLLVELAQRTGVRIVGVNYKDSPPGGLRFLGRYGNPYAAVGTDPAGRGAIEWGVYGMPETFILAGDGRIAFKHVGPISRESLEAKIIPEIEKLRGTAGS